jgi:hypothetical protein
MRLGYAHRHTLVDIDVHEGELRVYDRSGERLAVMPSTSGQEVSAEQGLRCARQIRPASLICPCWR